MLPIRRVGLPILSVDYLSSSSAASGEEQAIDVQLAMSSVTHARLRLSGLYNKFDPSEAKKVWQDRNGAAKVFPKQHLSADLTAFDLFFPVAYPKDAVMWVEVVRDAQMGKPLYRLRIRFSPPLLTNVKLLARVSLLDAIVGDTSKIRVGFFRQDADVGGILDRAIPVYASISTIEIVLLRGSKLPKVMLIGDVFHNLEEVPNGSKICHRHRGIFFRDSKNNGWCMTDGSTDVFSRFFYRRVKRSPRLWEIYTSIPDMPSDYDKVIAMYEICNRIFAGRFHPCKKGSNADKEGSCWKESDVTRLVEETKQKIGGLMRYINSR